NVTNLAGFTNMTSGLQIGTDGTIHLSFDDDTENVTGRDIFYTQSKDGGKTYSAPIKISTNTAFAITSSLALDPSGNIYIVYSAFIQSGISVYVAKSADGGKSFKSPVAVSTSSQFADDASIAVDKSGNILVAYSDFNSRSPRLFASRSSDGGASFSTPVALSKMNEAVMSNFIAFDSKGAAYVVYGDSGASTVSLATAGDGQTFAPSNIISATGTLAFFP